jgi:hypothetical protein
MGIELWIDEIVALAGAVESHRKNGKVRSYRVYAKAEIPEALSEYPCAISYPESVSLQISAGGPCKELWRGVTVFYLFPDSKKSNLPEVMRYFTRIRNGMFSSLTLGGKVDHFGPSPDGSTIELVTATYGDEVERHALQVRWEVKADISGEITVGV